MYFKPDRCITFQLNIFSKTLLDNNGNIPCHMGIPCDSDNVYVTDVNEFSVAYGIGFEYRVILGFYTYFKAYTLILIIRPTLPSLNRVRHQQSHNLPQACSQTGNDLGSFLHIEFHHNMFAINKHFRYIRNGMKIRKKKCVIPFPPYCSFLLIGEL